MSPRPPVIACVKVIFSRRPFFSCVSSNVFPFAAPSEPRFLQGGIYPYVYQFYAAQPALHNTAVSLESRARIYLPIPAEQLFETGKANPPPKGCLQGRSKPATTQVRILIARGVVVKPHRLAGKTEAARHKTHNNKKSQSES